MIALESRQVHFVLVCGLSREGLVSLAQELGLEFPGVRTSQLTPFDLADALTEKYLTSPGVAAAVARRLDERLLPLDLSFLESKKDYKEFRRALHDLEPRELARRLWRLAKEPRPEAKSAFKAVCDALDRREKAWEREDAQEILEGIVERSKEADELESELKGARESEKQKDKRIAELAREGEEIGKKLQEREMELSQAREKLRELKKVLEEHRRVEESAAETEALRSELARAASETESLRSELASAREKLGRYGRLKRIGLFVDVQNLIATAREAFGGALDFKALVKKVADGPESADRLVVESYAYLAEDPAREKAGLKGALRELGFTVRTRDILYRADGTAKGDWDLGMAVEVLERADRLDIVALGTGDGDFLDLVRHLKEKKPHLQVEVVCLDSPRHTSERLLQAADHVHRLGPRHLLREGLTAGR